MRLLLLLCTILLRLLASEQSIAVGAGPYLQTQPYQGADPFLLPSPVIFLEYEVLYIRWSRAGVYFAGGEHWGASVMIQPRTFGYRADDASILEGMARRKRSWEGGLSLAAKNDHGFVEFCYLHDLLNSSNRALAQMEIGTTLERGAWSFTPTATLLWLSQGYNDYYYGVRKSEATADRAAYRAHDGFNIALQSYISYTINDTFSLLTNLRLDLLDHTIVKSPIVDDIFIYSAMVSLLYHTTW